MVQMTLRAAGPTQGHIIHTLTQVILLHDSLCLYTAIPNKITSAQNVYPDRRRPHCHLAIVKTICILGRCRSVSWLNRKILTRFMRGQRPPLLYSVKLTLGHTQLRIQRMPDAIHPDVKRLAREPYIQRTCQAITNAQCVVTIWQSHSGSSKKFQQENLTYSNCIYNFRR